ncbi:glyoxylase-like metal-dependent hydrolase (beta-lactamase superfamily II) [Spirosoma oryzae]|uniref:Glyoxylase-like metal-dependent hydrolase (Beta-lactamase superfamily II) n=1 Tax=Spirosoma oryzae TaxID=1469603 RepID=A0A2T0SAJ3_9BACT|nr:MBL fold metallo-hydrolase [Spirosoma oryzae]PRY30440.1 glyoxylase-like metal-dependent hydrolase (beta-lactamase superfamily II) [Spirosoma oryzae]
MTTNTQLPHATSYLVKDTGRVKVHTLVSPAPMFANATHIIELPNELILVDGQFFAQYGQEFRDLADSLQKPISRFYVTHDHPDHFLGMGDAFADVPVYALPEIKESLATVGPHELEEKQHQMGSLIANRLSLPTEVVEPGEETIGGARFLFERVLDTESPVALVIKLPELGIVIAQDILYHDAHAFITGPVTGWKKALQALRDDDDYDLILPGHGKPAGKSDIDRAMDYLDKATELLAQADGPVAYKQALLTVYPDYAADKLIDIYCRILFR